MTLNIVRLVLVWILLFAIAGGEYLISTIHMPLASRPVILIPAIMMVVLVGFFFMHLNRMPVVAKGFAVAAVFWLVVLLGLTMMDPLTRHLWWVQFYNPM